MGFTLSLTALLKNHLQTLDVLCDTGFALAIHIRYTRPTLLYRTYAQDWSDHYTEQGFMLRDPVVHCGLANTGMVDWNDLADPEGVLASARAHGLFNGLTYSTGSTTSRTISGITRSTGTFSEQERAQVAEICDDVHRLTSAFETLPRADQLDLRGVFAAA